MYDDEVNRKTRSAIQDFKKKSQQKKRLWRRGFSEFYDTTDMKPIHVVTYNLVFLLKRFVLAMVLVFYRFIPGKAQVYVFAGIQGVFILHYFIFWWYMSIFKKVLHIFLDVLTLVAVSFPIWEGMLGGGEEAGRMAIHVFALGIIAAIVAC